MTAGEPEQIVGSVTASPAIDEAGVYVTVSDSTGADVSSDYAVTMNDIDSLELVLLDYHLALTVEPGSDVCNGMYVLSITAIAGTADASQQAGFVLVGGRECCESEIDSAEVLISPIGPVTAGATWSVAGTITTCPAIDAWDLDIDIADSSGVDVTHDFTLAMDVIEPMTSIDLEADLDLTLTPSTSACNGTYTLRITATAGTAASARSVVFVVEGGADCW